jgi:chromosome segregation protein
VQLRVENLSEHAMRRYQLDLSTFQPDGYGFLCAIREQKKRRQRQGVDEAGPETEGDASASVAPASEQASAEGESQTEAEPKEAIDWEFVASLVQEMTEKLDAMGPVNMEAIQEYDELEERHRFLEEQYNDLTKSKTELLDVISKINRTTRELFAETFEKVRVNFQEMFTELFGGGKANLILQDESDPLESGIEIIARPPGKQLQSISLLSGGEKTMTAVSLLFAIYMVKPSPFCVLDEMDAPLDESNINRFIKILDRFVGQSQFVVITHNKRTIARADVLYGVTMEEHGVSKPVGVRLTKRSESAQQAEGSTDLATHVHGEENVPSVAESFGKHGNLHSETVASPSATERSPAD